MLWEGALGQDDERLPGRVRRGRPGRRTDGHRLQLHRGARLPGWQACERAMWQGAAALDPGNDPALQSFHDEGMRSLEILDLTRRVIVTATAPLALTR
jgi:hypothetical protein